MYQGAKVTGVVRGHRRSFICRYENSFALVYSSDQFPSKVRTATFAENLAVISPASTCLVVILMVSRCFCRYKHKYSNARTRASGDEKPPFWSCLVIPRGHTCNIFVVHVFFIFSLFRCRFKHKYANARTRVSDDEKPTEREALTNVRRAVPSRMPLPIIFFSEALDTVSRVRQRRKTSLAHVCMMTALTRSTGTALHRQTIFPSRLRTLKVWGTFPLA